MSSSTPLPRTIYIGAFVQSISLKELEICSAGAIGVDEFGKIAFVYRFDDNQTGLEVEEAVKRKHGWEGCETVRINDVGFFFPGFIDTHIHATQYPNTGIFGSTTLLSWLEKYTFPLESSLSSLPLAKRVYTRVVDRTLSHGTTTAAYYATIHVPTTNLLADICLSKGQRAFVGRVCMDRMSPEDYRDESTEAAIKASREVIDYIHSKGDSLVQPIITPRFAPSCQPETLSALGALHRETGVRCQTHISENRAEIDMVKDLFPDHPSYAAVYDDAGLLDEKTILAHCVHLTEDEKALIKARDAKISHCPASNMALTSGLCPVRSLLERGIDVGLGTDVSGGYSPSVLEACRQCCLVSRCLAMQQQQSSSSSSSAKSDPILSVEEALYLATRGGAKVVGLEGVVGGFEVGMEWDAQMVSLGKGVSGDGEGLGGEEGQGGERGAVDLWGWEGWSERVQKWVWNGDDRNTKAVWVRGRLVHGKV